MLRVWQSQYAQCDPTNRQTTYLPWQALSCHHQCWPRVSHDADAMYMPTGIPLSCRLQQEIRSRQTTTRVMPDRVVLLSVLSVVMSRGSCSQNRMTRIWESICEGVATHPYMTPSLLP